MQRSFESVVTIVAAACTSACQWADDSLPLEGPVVEVVEAPSSDSHQAIADARRLMARELGLEPGQPESTGWTDSDRHHLNTLMLALELHEIWGLPEGMVANGRYTPELSAHLRDRIHEFGGTEPAAALRALLDRLDALVEAGIVLQ